MYKHLNDLKAGFSLAYVRAIAHAAGYFVQEMGRDFDSDGIDIEIMSKGPGGNVRSPRLGLQVKATEHPIKDDPFSFPLVMKNYEELRSEQLQVPRILVVVIVPKDISEWVLASEQELVLRHCGYWLNLKGKQASNNAEIVSVKIPRSNCFHVTQLQTLMDCIRDSGELS
jgi:hypothetical protein